VRRVREIGPEVRRQRGRGAGQTSQRRELFIRGGVYHIGLLGTFEDNDVRKQAYRSVVKVYDKARRPPDSSGAGRVPFQRSRLFSLFSQSSRDHQAAVRHIAARARRCQRDRAPHHCEFSVGKRTVHVCDRYRRPGRNPISRDEAAPRRIAKSGRKSMQTDWPSSARASRDTSRCARRHGTRDSRPACL